MKIRFAQKEDLDKIIELCQLHAEFEKAHYDPKNKKDLLSLHIFDKQHLKCLIIESNDEICGYATYVKQFSTWDAEFYIYLDCLFLEEKIRGKGYGKQIMEKIASYAKSENCKIMQWQTPDFNINAIEFYRKMGATSKTKERFFWKV